MNSEVKTYEKLKIDEAEILRYAKCKDASEVVLEILKECIAEASPVIKPALCYIELGRSEIEKFLKYASADSQFAKYVGDASHAILFCASLGFGLDMLIAKYERVAVSKAQLMHAIGAQQIEELCDMFCSDMKKLYPNSKPRFSPGYGGLDLSSQKQIIEMLGANKMIGVSLTDSLLMTPSKSVTAFICIDD